MPFQKGHKLATGRKKGSLNRSTEQAKLAIARIANDGLTALREDMQKIRKENPIEAARLWIKILEYIVPKKTQMELQGELTHRIEKVVVEIKR